jgi:hypothetical protein
LSKKVGRCTFDRESQTEHCDLAVTEDSGATNKGFIDIRYSSENGALKMIIRATTVGYRLLHGIRGAGARVLR